MWRNVVSPRQVLVPGLERSLTSSPNYIVGISADDSLPIIRWIPTFTGMITEALRNPIKRKGSFNDTAIN